MNILNMYLKSMCEVVGEWRRGIGYVKRDLTGLCDLVKSCQNDFNIYRYAYCERSFRRNAN